MSKKMLKRSLALGALMAFVITGSAYAGAKVINDAVDGVFKDPINHETSDKDADGRIYGIDFRGLSAGETITFEKEVSVTVTGEPDTGNNSFVGGIRVEAWPNKAGTLVAEEAVNIDVKTGTAKYAYGVTAYDYANLNFEKGINVLVKHNNENSKAGYANFNAYGLAADADAVINVEDEANIAVQGNAVGMGVKATTAYSETENRSTAPISKVHLKGNTTILVESGLVETSSTDEINKYDIDAYGVYAELGGNVVLNGAETQVTANAENGRASAITAVNGAKVTLDKIDNLSLVANAKNEEVAYAIYAHNQGKVDVKAKEAYFKGGIIETENGEVTIDVENFTWDASGTGEPNSVTNLNGTGTVIVAGNNDKVYAKAGTAELTVQATGTYAEEIASANDQADALQDLADQVYGAETVTVTQVGTEEGEITGAVTAQVGEGGKVVAGSIKEAVNTTNQAIGEAAVNLKAHYRAHMNDMNKRMGELRMANGEAGVWTRMVRGENEFEGAKSQYNQYQLGYDEKLSVDKRWTVGAAVTFAEGEGSFGKGSTEDDSTAFAIYGSKLNNDGTFVDLIARYARLESDITMGANTADYSTNGYSVSAEFGKRIQQGNGLWIEPQVELTYGTVDSAEYVIDGKNVQVGDMDSIIGRVGFSLGKDIKQGNVYARASYLYDFDGETETTFGKNGVTRTIEEDLGGGWWEVGVGANINLSKATYVYADVEKTFGGEIDTNWQWNLGVRYSF